MNALLPLGLVLLTLLAIAYLTWRFATVSRLRQTMGRPFILLGRACLLAADSCKRTYERTLAWSETYVIARLIYLAVAIGIFLGDYSISRLRGAALMGMDVQPISWLPLENFAGLLWLLVPAMLGAGALDLLEVIHEGWRLFSHLERIPKFLRIVLAGFMGMAFVLSLLVSALFVLWGQLALLQTATRIDQDQLALYIVAAFGILLAVVSCEAFYAVLVGLGALVSVAVGATYCVLRLLHLLLALCGDTIAGASPDYRPSYGQPAYTVVDAAAHIRALPPASPAQETDVSETTISEPESEELTRMATVYRTVTVLGYGLVSSRFVSLTLDYAAAAGAGGVLLGSAVIDPTHTYRRETLPTVSGVPNYTPTLQAMQNAYADEVLEPAMTKLAHTLHEQVIEGCAEKHAGVLFVAVDIAVLPLVITPLRSLHTRLPNQEMLLVCPVSRLDMQRPEQVQEVSAWLGKLQEDGIVATTLLVDANRSPMARKGDAATIEKAAMQTLFGLLIAQYSDESNPSLGEVLQQVGTQSPCMGLAYSAAQVVSGRTPLAWQVVKAVAPKVGDRGSGSMSDMLIQAVACTKQVFTDEATTASPQPLDAQKPCFVLFHLPYARGDKRFAETATSLSRFLHATYPQAQGIMVHGNGVALPTLEGKYRVGVSCLYPLTLPVSGHTEELTLDELRLEVPSEDVPLVKGNGRRKHEAVEK